MGPQPNATHPNEREPGARERESERLFLATMPSSSLLGSQRPRERRRTCLLSSSVQGGSRPVHHTCPGAFGCPQERTVPMLSAADWGAETPAMHFSCFSPSLDHEPWTLTLVSALYRDLCFGLDCPQQTFIYKMEHSQKLFN